MLLQDTQLISSGLLNSPLTSAESAFTLNLTQDSKSLQLPTFFGAHSSYPKTIAFIDSTVPDVSTLLTNVQSDIKIFLDPTRDGVAQITETLKHYQGLTGIEIISHGNDAELQLGNSFLSALSLQQYAPQLQQWAASLATGADILLYGCDVAQNDLGKSFVNQISQLTGADVAASTDLTGNTALGGNWILEYATGSIELGNPFTDYLMHGYQGLLATLFTTQTPAQFKTDGSGSAGDYELGMEFRSARAGTINAIRYYKAPNETGTHIGRIWSSTGTLLASVTFTNETASGWQQQALATPLAIQANTTYVVSVNANTYYAFTGSGIATTITNGDLSAVADGSNGVYNLTPGSFPTQSFQNSNYFRDVDFTATVSNPNNRAGTIAVSGTPTQNQTLTATVSDLDGLPGTIAYQWQQSSNGTTWTNIAGAISQTFTLTQAQVNQRVRATASYTDLLGTSETLNSDPTLSPVANVNDIGVVTISGTPTQNQTLTATVTDVDGLPATINYQWQQSSDGITWNNITGATARTLTLQQVQVGQRVRAIASYTDLLSPTIIETVNSNPTTAVANVNDIGVVAISGTPTQGQTLTATVTDIDGLPATINYQWQQSTNGTTWSNITGATARTLTLQAAQVGRQVRVRATYTDVLGTLESNRTSPATTLISNANNNPGTVSISGTVMQNEILTATVNDADGLPGTISYQWQQSSNGTTWTNIAGATARTLALQQAQVGQQVRVRATYTDTLGSSEVPTSAATTTVVNVNDPGTVAISGTTAQGNTLTAAVSDPDGLTGVSIAYQWQRLVNSVWTDITGATTQTLSLDSSLVGSQLRVSTIYVDTLGGSENILSLPTSPISAQLDSIFTATTVPSFPNFTDGPGVDYELGMRFTSNKTGQVQAIRYYKSPSETGTHVGRIWSSTGTLLASVTFTNETASGWQQQALATPLTIQANTTYIVSVNTNGYYADTVNGFATAIGNGSLTAPVGAGVYNETIGAFPTLVYQNENYYRDVVFAPTPTNPNNRPGTITLSGTATQNQTLTANVADQDGLTGATIRYQWQQSSNGTTWTNIAGATSQTLTLTQAQVSQFIRVTATYTDALGTDENLSTQTPAPVANVNDPGTVILKGSPTNGATLDQTVFDADGLTGSSIGYQWQQLVGSVWTNIAGATTKTLALTSALVGQQVRVLASYIDALGTSENAASPGVAIAAQNAIVLENQKPGTTAWQLTNRATTEILGYGDATSINKGQAINLKISLAQAGQYRLDVYRLGYYGGTGGRLITSVTGLNGVTQAAPTMTNTSTRLVEYRWNTSYTLQTGADWTTGLYLVKLTDSRTGRQNYIQFVLRDDNRPADLGFQDAITTAAAYNNIGGYSVYDFNSTGGQRAYQVSFDRPFQYTLDSSEQFNNMLTWEYNMTRWLESQGYDVSYYTNLDVSTNPLQLYSQKTYLSVGHDEYWSMEQRNNVQQARDNGINLAFFSANTAYWQVRFDPSSTGQANRVMTIYKDSSYPAIGTGSSLDPIAQTNPTAATTLFRSPEVNRPENALLGVGYIGDWGSANVYNGFDFVISNAADPYYANTGLRNGDRLAGLVGYEWDGLLNNGLTPAGLVVLSQSPVQSQGQLPPLPPGTSTTIANAVRYTAPSGAKVFSTGSIQWVWGLDSSGVTNPRVDRRAQQIAVNVFKDMGAKPQTPDAGIVV